MKRAFQVELLLVQEALTKAEHDARVAERGRPLTQEPVGWRFGRNVPEVVERER